MPFATLNSAKWDELLSLLATDDPPAQKLANAEKFFDRMNLAFGLQPVAEKLGVAHDGVKKSVLKKSLGKFVLDKPSAIAKLSRMAKDASRDLSDDDDVPPASASMPSVNLGPSPPGRSPVLSSLMSSLCPLHIPL